MTGKMGHDAACMTGMQCSNKGQKPLWRTLGRLRRARSMVLQQRDGLQRAPGQQ